MPATRPRYAPEFRAEAMRLVREGGRTPQQLAQDLGCCPETIRNWLKQADLDEGRRSDGLTTAERLQTGGNVYGVQVVVKRRPARTVSFMEPRLAAA